jgi:hypothetical protein
MQEVDINELATVKPVAPNSPRKLSDYPIIDPKRIMTRIANRFRYVIPIEKFLARIERMLSATERLDDADATELARRQHCADFLELAALGDLDASALLAILRHIRGSLDLVDLLEREGVVADRPWRTQLAGLSEAALMAHLKLRARALDN